MQHSNIIYYILNILNPYHWITWLRNRAFDKSLIKNEQFDLPVICIGNITVGGTGKTPHTEHLIKLLKDRYNTAVLSRGYGRKSKGYILADNFTTMEMIGDEPFQMANKFANITVAVDEKRVNGINNLINREHAPQVILLDDAYQHRYVKAGLYILLIDYNRPIWKDCVLPIGRLREAASGIERADIIIITKCPNEITLKEKEEYINKCTTKNNTNIFFTTMQYGSPYSLFEKDKLQHLTPGVEILLVTGIARPQPLKKRLEEEGAIVTLMQYADHHNFKESEITDITNKFCNIKGKDKLIITTEKDATRLQCNKAIPDEIKKYIYVMPIEVAFIDNKENMFNQIILDYVSKD